VIAVADTSPLCYLVLIGEIEVLPALFSEVIVPTAVAAELSDTGAPEAVQRWWSRPPDWLRAAPVENEGTVPGIERLHRGEQGAISLAMRTPGAVLLVDDKAARHVATAFGLPVMGLLGVLGAASERGLVDLSTAIERLQRTNFRVAPALLRDLLERDRSR
jgi:predicted nucleic acid-binding protein